MAAAPEGCCKACVKGSVLMATLRRAALISSLSQWLMYIISFAKIIVVSRLLDADELGTFTLAASLVILAQFLRIFGTWDYMIAEKELTEEKLRGCFTILLGAALAITVIFIASAEFLTWLFEAPELKALIYIMVPTFLLLPIGGVTLGMMQRELEYETLSKIRLASTMADTGLSIGLVLLGFGVLSLGWGYAATNIVATLLIVLWAPRHLVYRPIFRGLGHILGFGWLAALGTFLNQVASSGPPLVLGLGTNTAVVGIFGRGQTPITFFRQGIDFATRPVTQAHFAQQARDNIHPAATHLKISQIMAGVAWPVYIGLFFGAPTLVPFLLGAQWDIAVPVTQILCLGGLLSFYSHLGVSVLEGRGLVKKRLLFNLAAQGIRFALLAASVIWGDMTTFCWALVVSHVISFVLITAFIRQETDLTLSDVVLGQKRSALVGGALIALCLVLFGLVYDTPKLSTLPFLGFCCRFIGVWGLALWATRHPLWLEGTAMLARRRSPSQSHINEEDIPGINPGGRTDPETGLDSEVRSQPPKATD